ncbi:MAG: PrsW family glutamic-type intramembrane protease [bacterium]
MTEFMRMVVSILPVFLFLAALIVFDSYKLVKLQTVVLTILIGCLAALICFLVNNQLYSQLEVDFKTFIRYVSPFTEESVKSIYIIYLLRKHKVGFLVDSAIYGFAIGTGFAFIENVFYLHSVQNSNFLIWVVRGFGTAVMHGTATAFLAVFSKSLSDWNQSVKWFLLLPGLLAAVFTHSFYNHFFLPPAVITLAFVVLLPMVFVALFERSEKITRKWLGVGFDTDVELLEMIVSGKISETRIGKYLDSLKNHFPGEVVADLFCLLRINLELAIRAKGILLMRQSGFKAAAAPDIKQKLEELQYLEKSIGRTGKLAILPFLHTSHRDLWQLYMVK